jgi:hypothetical protein
MRPNVYREAVANLFRTHQGQWIDGMRISYFGGTYAWRSRISDCRVQLGMQILNRQRKVGKRTVSEYQYVPGPAQGELSL